MVFLLFFLLATPAAPATPAAVPATGCFGALRIEAYTAGLRGRVDGALRALYRDHIDLGFERIYYDNSPETGRILNDQIGHPMTGRVFYELVGNVYQAPWLTALRHNEIPLPADYRPPSLPGGIWSPDLFDGCLGSLWQMHAPLNIKALEKRSDPLTERFLRRRAGAHTNANGFYQFGRRLYGSWDAALIANYIDPVMVRQDRLFWTEARILDAIEKLSRYKVKLDATSMRTDADPRVPAILNFLFGRRIKASQLYNAGKRKFRGWGNALSRAGEDADAIRRLILWDRPKLLAVGEALIEDGVPMHFSNILKDERGVIPLITRARIGRAIQGAAIAAAARSPKHFGGWDAFLVALGLEPATVHRTFWRRSNLLALPHQVLYQDFGGRPIVYALGREEALPDAKAEENEFINSLYEVTNTVPEKEREGFRQMLDLIFASYDTLDADQIAALLSEEGSATDVITVQKWLGTLAEHHLVRRAS